MGMLLFRRESLNEHPIQASSSLPILPPLELDLGLSGEIMTPEYDAQTWKPECSCDLLAKNYGFSPPPEPSTDSSARYPTQSHVAALVELAGETSENAVSAAPPVYRSALNESGEPVQKPQDKTPAVTTRDT